jgi:N-acetyl-gamma-glutamylphosphate reductase
MAYASLGELDLDGVDLVMAALPHGASQAVAGAVLEAGAPFVDLGADSTAAASTGLAAERA